MPQDLRGLDHTVERLLADLGRSARPGQVCRWVIDVMWTRSNNYSFGNIALPVSTNDCPLVVGPAANSFVTAATAYAPIERTATTTAGGRPVEVAESGRNLSAVISLDVAAAISSLTLAARSLAPTRNYVSLSGPTRVTATAAAA